MLCIKLVNYWDKHTEMHGKQNVKISVSGLPTDKQHAFRSGERN